MIIVGDIAFAERKNISKIQTIVIEKKYHHLGDDQMDNWIVPEPEGTLWETTFRIKKSTLDKCKISFVKFLCHGLDNAAIIVNGNYITLDPSDEKIDQNAG